MNLKNPLHFTFKQKFANLGIFIVSYIINYTFNVFLTRHYPPKIYGDITVTIMALWLIVPFVLQGSNLSSIRFLPEYLSARQINKFYGFQHWATKILIFTSSFICIIGFILALAILFLEKYPFFNAMKGMIFSFWLIPLFGLMSYQSSILLSIQKQSISIATTGLFPFFTTCFLAIFIFIFGRLDPSHAFICIGLSLFMIIALQRVAISIFLKTIVLSFQEFSFEDKKVWRHVSLHLMINSIIYVGISSVDTFMLKILSSNKTVVAEFSVLLVMVGMYLLIQNASISTLSPLIAPLIRNQKMNQLQIFLNKSLIFKFSLGLVVFLLFLIYGKSFLGHFGQFYQSLYVYLEILSITFFISLNCGFAITLLSLSGHQSTVTKIVFLQLIIAATLNILLIPKYHLIGAIISLCVGILIAQLLAVTAVKYYLKLKLLYFF